MAPFNSKVTNGNAKSKNTKAAAEVMVDHNGHDDDVMVDQVEVRSVLERQAELISKQKDDLVELRKRLEDNVR